MGETDVIKSCQRSEHFLSLRHLLKNYYAEAAIHILKSVDRIIGESS
jgi:hypothetical protein